MGHGRYLLIACVILGHVCDTAAHPLPMPKQVEEDVAKNQKSLRRCVQESMKRDAPTNGFRLLFDITVDQTRRISKVKVRGAPAPKLEECFVTAVRRWKMTVDPGDYSFKIVVQTSD